MDDGYRLQDYTTPAGHTFWELVGNPNGDGEFAKMLRSSRKKRMAINLIRQIDKVIDRGIKQSCATGKMRLIDAGIGLYELKGYDGANREMAYVLYSEPLEVVLPFSFKGHQGSGNIHLEIKKARPLAKIAMNLLEQMHADKTD